MIELDLQLASEAQAPSQADFQRWCELALRQRSADSELTIRVVDEAEGRELNRTWRHKDYATNVLSFPAEMPEGLPKGVKFPLLGDLVICHAVVAREADEQHHSSPSTAGSAGRPPHGTERPTATATTPPTIVTSRSRPARPAPTT